MVWGRRPKHGVSPLPRVCAATRESVSRVLGVSDVWSVWLVVQHVHHVWSSRSPPVRERHPATGGASPLKAHRRRHGAGPLDTAGDLVARMAGLGRSMLTGPDSLVTEFIPALRTV